MLVLCRCSDFSLVGGSSLVAVHGLLIAEASPAVEYGPGLKGTDSGVVVPGPRCSEGCGPPGSGIKPVSP